MALISVKDFSDIHLFLINFADKLYGCSKYLNSPKDTKQILCAVGDPDSGVTATKSLEEIILTQSIPRNDVFVKLFGSRS